jgi:hypothetical protein
MNVAVPVLYKDIKLTEGEAMIVALLALICDENGYDQYYVMNSYDFKKILSNKPGGMHFDSPHLDTLRTHMHIIGLDDHNWALKFKWKEFKDIKVLRGTTHFPRTYRHAIHENRSHGIWGFLMGKMHADKDILSDNTTDVLPYKSSTRVLDRMWHENFKMDHYK